MGILNSQSNSEYHLSGELSLYAVREWDLTELSPYLWSDGTTWEDGVNIGKLRDSVRMVQETKDTQGRLQGF